MIFIRYPFPYDLKCLNFEKSPVCGGLIRHSIESYLRYKDFTLLCNGKKLHDAEVIEDNSTIHVSFLLPGGKGGFGSMLRAIGAQIEKTTNREACRDLSGRRLRDINEEQRLKKWIAKEAEREAEKIRRRQERIERLKNKPPHNFFDFEYEKEISQLPERINDALSEGLQKAKQAKKRPHENSAVTKLPKKSWLSDELPTSSSESDSEEQKNEGDSSASKKLKTISEDNSSCNSDISDPSQPRPGSSKDVDIDFEETIITNTEHSEMKPNENMEESNSNKKGHIQHENNGAKCEQNNGSEISVKEIEKINASENESQVNTNENTVNKCIDVSHLNNNAAAKAPELQDISINLDDFQSISELEALGLDSLKSALMSRGLKCGGTLFERAERLWKVRGLQPNEYPANLLAKKRK